MSWLYKTEVIEDISQFPKDTYGFIYRVIHLPSGKSYIGRKNLYHNRKQKLTKKEIALLTGPGRKPTHKRVEKESDWLNYYGSNKEVIGLIKEGKSEEFKKYIIKLAPNKKLLTYYETKYLFVYGVLEKPDEYYNDNILGKFYTKDLENQ
tara:strand:- start:6 stop:455 length:450 start_codon:yes stop_codon:yes gene_type:complete